MEQQLDFAMKDHHDDATKIGSMQHSLNAANQMLHKKASFKCESIN